jgi:Tfp pilus assembly protein PilN
MARRINLIPRSERPRTKTDWAFLGMVGLFIIVIFGLGFGYYSFSNTLDERRQALDDLKTQTAALEQQVDALHEYEVLASSRENVQGVVQSIYSNRTLLSDVLDAVGLVVPDNTWFQGLDLTATDPVPQTAEATTGGTSTVKVGTLSLDGETYSFEDVSRLIVRLQLIPGLSNVTLSTANETQHAVGKQLAVKGFSITADVVQPEAPGALPLTDVEVQDQ